MDISIASARPQDEDFLWVMIYYAAHMEEDGAASLFAAQDHCYLQKYVAGWGAPGDVGVIGYDGSKPIGAVWSRLLIGDNKTYGYIDDYTPELAAAVLPEYIGEGVGTKLLQAHVIVKEITNRVGKYSYLMAIYFADVT